MDWQFKPARDFGLPPAERLKSQNREAGVIGTTIHWAWHQLARLYLKGFHRLVVEGRDNLPTRPPFVMIANHTSHLDALTLGAALKRSQMVRAHALAAGDTFFSSRVTASFAAYAINALPVWRKHTSVKDLEGLRQRLGEDGLVFILFPEGTRSRTGIGGKFLPGIGALVAGTDVPVVPCRLEGAFEAWPRDRRFPLPRKVRLTIGPPLSFADLPHSREGWVDAAGRCEHAVAALAPPESLATS